VGLRALEQAERAQESIGDQLFAALSDEERVMLRSLLSRALEPSRQP
jgi:DNA-binding MarR family transcriptional regulator